MSTDGPLREVQIYCPACRKLAVHHRYERMLDVQYTCKQCGRDTVSYSKSRDPYTRPKEDDDASNNEK